MAVDPRRRRVAETLTRLTRLAERRPDTVGWLAEAIAGRLEELTPAALEVASQTGASIGRALAESAFEEDDEETLGAMAEWLDAGHAVHSVAVRELALIVVTRNLERRQRLWKQPGIEQRASLAGLKLTRALRLDEAGRADEGIAAAEDAVADFRDLARAAPRYVGDLADAHHNLALLLGQCGETLRGLEHAYRALRLERRLARRQPGMRGSQRAVVYDHLGILLYRYGQPDRAVRAARTARRLAETSTPDSDPALPGKVSSNLGLHLWATGEAEEARQILEQAVDLLEQVDDVSPLIAGPHLAAAYQNFSLVLAGLGRAEEALDASRKSVAVRRRFYEWYPELYRDELATGLTNLGLDLASQGSLEDAVAATREAVELYRTDPAENVASSSRLAWTCFNLADLHEKAGDLSGAKRAIDEALRLLEDLEARLSDAPLANLALAHEQRARLARQEEDLETARSSLDLAAEQWERISQRFPEEGLSRLADCLEKQIEAHLESGHLESALELATRKVEVCRRLRDLEPAAATDVAVAQANVAMILDHLERFDEALEVSAAALRGLDAPEARALDPNRPRLLHAHGLRLERAGQDAEAATAFRQAIELWRRVDPSTWDVEVDAEVDQVKRDLGRIETTVENQ